MAEKPKTIWTSYYAMTHKLPHGTHQVVISNKIPDWWHAKRGIIYRDLAPPTTFKVRTGWLAAYDEWLDDELVGAAYYELPNYSVLLDYDKDPNKSHRKVIWRRMKSLFPKMLGGEFNYKGGGAKPLYE